MKNILNAIGIIFSSMLSMILYVTIIAILLLFGIKSVFSFNTINKLVQNIDVKNIINDIDGEKNVIDIIYTNCEKINISSDSVNLLLNSNKVKYIVSEYIYGGLYYLTTANENKIVTEEYFKSYINNNIDSIINDANIKYSKNEINSIKKLIIDNSNIIFQEIPDAKNILSQINNSALEYIRFFFSIKSILLLFGIIILLLLLIAISRWSIYKWMGWFGITCLFSSIIGFVIGLLPMFNFSSLFYNLPSYIINIIDSSKTIISMCFIRTSIYSIIIAILILILHYILKKKYNKEV